MSSFFAASRLATFVALLALTCACAATSTPAPDATPSPISIGRTSSPDQTASVAPTAPPLPSGPVAEIDVLVSGGDLDGSYRAVAANACDSDAGGNTFTVAYANDFAADDFIALDLVLRDAAQAQQDSSNDFVLEISLNGDGGGVSYTLDPADDQGEGDAFLDIIDDEATLDLSVITPDEAIIDLTVICDLV